MATGGSFRMSSSMDLVTDSRVFCRGSLVAVASAIV